MRSNHTALRRARERAGHTRPSLAEASGVSQQRIWDLEQQPVAIRPTTAKQLADALGVEIPDITLDDEPAEVAS